MTENFLVSSKPLSPEKDQYRMYEDLSDSEKKAIGPAVSIQDLDKIDHEHSSDHRRDSAIASIAHKYGLRIKDAHVES